ncbi:hypothetical protein BKA69DRAFT_630585 [Paraphysoderma sedebokerense]|nr:hypothetical protein BKA69DRAFT_630585 [Paraphysoderma sedebokerense]
MEKILSLFEFFCKRYSRLVISSTSSSSLQRSSSPATSVSPTPSSSANTSLTDLSIITSVNKLHSSGIHPSTNTSTSNINEIHDLNIYRNLISFLLDTIFIMLFGSSSSSSPSSFSFSYSSQSSILPTPPEYSNNPVKSSDRVQESRYVRKPSVNTLITTLKKWNIPLIHVCLVKMELFHWILKNICHDKGEIGGRKKQERTAVNKDTAGQNKERCKVSNVEDIGHKHEMKWQVLTSIIIEVFFRPNNTKIKPVQHHWRIRVDTRTHKEFTFGSVLFRSHFPGSSRCYPRDSSEWISKRDRKRFQVRTA